MLVCIVCRTGCFLLTWISCDTALVASHSSLPLIIKNIAWRHKAPSHACCHGSVEWEIFTLCGSSRGAGHVDSVEKHTGWLTALLHRDSCWTTAAFRGVIDRCRRHACYLSNPLLCFVSNRQSLWFYCTVWSWQHIEMGGGGVCEASSSIETWRPAVVIKMYKAHGFHD